MKKYFYNLLIFVILLSFSFICSARTLSPKVFRAGDGATIYYQNNKSCVLKCEAYSPDLSKDKQYAYLFFVAGAERLSLQPKPNYKAKYYQLGSQITAANPMIINVVAAPNIQDPTPGIIVGVPEDMNSASVHIYCKVISCPE